MIALSLFDGMSCLQIALKEMNIPVERYYASEIDAHAIKQTQFNFPNTIQLGDVTKWKEWDIDWSTIDIIGAGSPCQGFSFAGKQLAFDDPRSKLFFVFVDILTHIRTVNPDVKFLLENVRMKAEHEAVITQYVGVNPIYINSALVSAQNRERIYWTNICMVQRGLFGDYYPNIPQPDDRGILLKDILESDVDSKYYLSEKAHRYITDQTRLKKKFTQINGDKSTTLLSCGTANNTGTFIDKYSDLIEKSIINEKSTPIDASYYKGFGVRSGTCRQVVSDLVITHNLQARQGKGQGGKGHLQKYDQKSYCLDTGNCQAVEILGCDYRTDEGIRIRENGKSGTLAARARNDESCGQLVIKREVTLNDNQQAKFNPDVDTDKHNTVTMAIGRAGSSSEYMDSVSKVSKITGIIRRLTPTECSRLQTIPDWYKWNCSDTQQYRMLGNGWTVEVIIWILKHLNN